MTNMTNQQQSSEKENVQRLEQKFVPLNGEKENALASNVEGKDIVQKSKRGLNRLKSKEFFLQKAFNKYGSKFKYDLDNFNGMTKNKIKIICPIHGEFEQTPHTFLLKNCSTGCKQCGREKLYKGKTKTYKNFIETANKIHNNKYVYPTENKYLNRKSKIKIICPIHGEFVKSAQKHLSGQGCFKCKIKQLINDNILLGGYNDKLFELRPELKNLPGILYYIKINSGEIYKIGISIKTVKSRFKQLKYKAKGVFKTFECIWQVQDTLFNCYKKEQEILNLFKEHRIYNSISTELFNKDVIPLGLKHIPTK